LKTLPGVSTVCHQLQDGRSELELALSTDEALSGVVATLTAHNSRLLNLQKREPTLEDVFVDLVGLSIAEADKPEDGEA
jgi:ABC-2 type transport system ATP-binding protein